MDKVELKNEIIEHVEQGDFKLLKILRAVIQAYDEPLIHPAEDKVELHRMVYTSARMKHCDEDAIAQILTASRKNNPKLNVSGLLIHTKDRFIQILEGSKANISSVYERIQKDDRHAGTSVRFFEPVAQREFGEWNMAHKSMATDSVQYNTDTSEENKALYESLMDGDLFSYKDDGMRVLKTFLMIS